MKIIVDMMGGDNAPLAVLEGAAQAVKEYGVQLIGVGNEALVRKTAAEHNISLDGIELVNCTETIEMCDEPARAIRQKKDSSIVVGLNMLKEGRGDAFVSAGSTGALHVGASLIVRTLRGVKRPALATMVPAKQQAYLLLDCGANVECRPEMLAAFAVMGSCYVNKVEGRKNPSVALANNGAEESKGTPVLRDAHQLLKTTPGIRFVGNIEPRDVPNGEVDVVVCDGFTGNVILKLTEGVAKMLLGMLKQMFLANLGGKLAYLLLKGGVTDLKHQMDSEEYGGAPFLGAKQPVIKAHGSSKAKGIKNAIRQAKICVENDLCGTMQSALDELAAAQKPEEKKGVNTTMSHQLETIIGYKFKNPELLEIALTHTSYANESRTPVKHNERLEFLGDSVLQIVSADYLFHAYADRPEGDLTRIRASLVSESALFQFAQEIDLGEYLRLGRGEERCGGRTRPSVVSDAFEAVIAALYLDGGMEVARKFILPFITEGKHAEADYKTRLQEIVQQNPEERLSYVVESESGPDHDKHFVVAVRFNSDRVARGEGRSKKAAEQCAAKEALKLLGVIKEK